MMPQPTTTNINQTITSYVNQPSSQLSIPTPASNAPHVQRPQNPPLSRPIIPTSLRGSIIIPKDMKRTNGTAQ
jgi:hypothetical protein